MSGKTRPASALDSRIPKSGDIRSRPHSALGTSSVSSGTKNSLRPQSGKQLKMPAGSILRTTPETDNENFGLHPPLDSRPSSAGLVHKFGPSIHVGRQFGQISKPLSRPNSALGRLQASSAMKQLPRESSGRGFGRPVGLLEDSASVLEKQNLLARVREIVAQHSYAGAVKTESKIEEELQPDSESDEGEEFETIVVSKARQVFDLRPTEMARLNRRFPPEGLAKKDFEQVMKEFTGMDLELGSQLFCKIDANDDGSINWDEFLSYVVQASDNNQETSDRMSAARQRSL